MKFQPKQILPALAVVALLTAGGFLAGAVTRSQAAEQTSVGYVDVQRLIDLYAIPDIKDEVEAEQQRLQTELDAKLKDAADNAKEALAKQYQGQLDSTKDVLLNKALAKAEEKLALIQKELGVDVILDSRAVVAGGTDVTDSVLFKLGIKVK